MANFADGGAVGRRPAPHPIATLQALMAQGHPAIRRPMPMQHQAINPEAMGSMGHQIPGPPQPHQIPPDLMQRIQAMAQMFGHQQPNPGPFQGMIHGHEQQPIMMGPFGTGQRGFHDLPPMIAGGQFGGFPQYTPASPYGGGGGQGQGIPGFHPMTYDTFLPWTLDPRNPNRPQ